MKYRLKVRFLVFLFLISFTFSSINLVAESNQAIVPLKIIVSGKLVITDAENDNISGKDPTINVLLRLTPDLNESIVSGSSGIRIRTNLNYWKLIAQRTNETSTLLNIDPGDISLSFTTTSGSKANPNAGKLLSPFDTVANLSHIPVGTSKDILIGNSKTSADKDPLNKNNWFQVTTNYSVSPDFFYDIGEWKTTISYNLVSP